MREEYTLFLFCEDEEGDLLEPHDMREHQFAQKRDGMRYCLLIPKAELGMLGSQTKNSILLTYTNGIRGVTLTKK